MQGFIVLQGQVINIEKEFDKWVESKIGTKPQPSEVDHDAWDFMMNLSQTYGSQIWEYEKAKRHLNRNEFIEYLKATFDLKLEQYYSSSI